MRLDVFKGRQFSLKEFAPKKIKIGGEENWLFKIKHYNAATAAKISPGQLPNKNSTSKKDLRTNQLDVLPVVL